MGRWLRHRFSNMHTLARLQLAARAVVAKARSSDRFERLVSLCHLVGAQVRVQISRTNNASTDAGAVRDSQDAQPMATDRSRELVNYESTRSQMARENVDRHRHQQVVRPLTPSELSSSRC